MNHTVDTIVIGGSAGSLGALKQLLAALPDALPATILICQHQSISAEFHAAQLLQPYTSLPIVVAEDGMEMEPGRIIFAGPGSHLMLGQGHVHLRRGAHENNFRPAIDPLFRSAAIYRSTRVIGVVLTGLMNDGASGARAIARTGGRILVQHPEEAEFPDMPKATLESVPDAEALTMQALAERLLSLAGSPARPSGEIPWDIGIEVKIAGLEGATMGAEHKLGELSPYNCPHCNGVLWQIEDGPVTRFRCHTGHAYTMEALDVRQEEALDEGLFNALRGHRGRAALLRQMADRMGNDTSRNLYRTRAEIIEEDAERLEGIIKSRNADNPRSRDSRGASPS